MLLIGVITHGYNPIYFLTGTLLSLLITKVHDWCIMPRYSDNLATSGLQFSFKSAHSTTMCSLVTKEVVTYYWNRLSRVYAAFIDASKAFDMIRYDCLFGILIKRELPPIIIMTIMDMHER